MLRLFFRTKYFFLSLVVVGCATVKPIIGPDGTQNYLVTCDGIEYCYDKAREVCGGNYQIVNTSSSTNGSDGNTSTETNLLVKCAP
jgi:hypothetical protein